MKPPYFLIEDGLPTGPHSLIVLLQKAEIRMLKPDASVRPLAPSDAPWLPIRSIPDLHALLFPPKTAPTLGTAHFSSTYPPIDTATRPFEVERMLRENTAQQVAAERFNPSAIPSRRLRRHRSFLISLLAFAAPAWAVYRFGVVPRTEMSVILLGSFVCLAALLLYWILYHVSDLRS